MFQAQRERISISILVSIACALASLAPSTAHAFGASFWKNRARAPFWPAPRKNPSGGNPASCNGVGDGVFQACYFNGTDFNDLKVVRDETRIDFDWKAGSPDPSVQSDRFSVRFTGRFDFDGQTTFTVSSDDGVRLYIDDQLAIDQWNDHGPLTFTHSRSLSRGKHKIELEYYEDMTNALVRLSWNSGGGGGGGGTGTAGCSGGRLVDPKAYFLSVINRAEGSSASDWATVLDASGIPTAPGPGVRPNSNDHFGITQQRGAGGNVRGRLFLPTDTPDSNGYYLHAIDVLVGSPLTWGWSDWISGQPAYAPATCQ
jgi:hypothetical protein